MIHFSVIRAFSFRIHMGRSYALSYNGARQFASTRLRSQDGEGSNQVEATDILQEFRNENNIRDQVFSAISGDGSVKVTVCTARNLLNDLMLAHSMTATPADALGRTLVCALLMSNGIQAEQTLQITMNCKYWCSEHFDTME